MSTETAQRRPESPGLSSSSDWHAHSTDNVLAALHTSAEMGLSSDAVARLIVEHGPNELAERDRKSVWRMLWEQLAVTLVFLLIVAAIVSAAVGDFKDAVAIAIIIVVNTALGLFHDHRAERAMAMLTRMAVPIVKVRRDGRVQEVSSRDLVPGDVVLLEAGDLVPADCRILESANLRVQEATLTGESEPAEKSHHALTDVDLPICDRLNMVYMGTSVAYGRGVAVVAATGRWTELGRIADLIQSVDREPTRLQRRLGQLGRVLAGLAVVLVGVIFASGLMRGEPLKLMFLTAVSMAVAAVPEGLPAVVTIALALGAQRMLKRKVVIRKLLAVETLGSVTVICSDKTGTLTENRMTVAVLDVAGRRLDFAETLDSVTPSGGPEPGRATVQNDDSGLTLLLTGVALCNDAVLVPQADPPTHFHTIGDPTEGALVVAAARYGMGKPELDLLFPRVAEAPFDSDRKRMTTIHEMPLSPSGTAPGLEPLWAIGPVPPPRRWIAFTKGAAEPLLQVSSFIWVGDRVVPIDDEWRTRAMRGHDSLAHDGMRVLGVAFRVLTEPPAAEPSSVERDLVFVGLAGMNDPPRPEVKEAVATCRRAGIRPVMITGDHPLTARFVAAQLGIDGQGAAVVTGQDLARMTDEQLQTAVGTSTVFARVSPEHKLRIVQALQAQGQVVAMTGDGVNDAPALRRADIGVAMGIAGTEVSKEAADMVLTDDNFAAIVSAVEEGRVIYDNIRKFIKYLLTSNTGELWVMLLAPLLGMPLPLLPLQILWINLVTDGLPALALSVEPAEAHTMRRAPVSPTENILSRGLLWQILWGGLVVGLAPLTMGYYFLTIGDADWQTMVFTTLTLSQLAYVLAVRSSRDSFFRIGALTNTPLALTVVFTFLLQLMVTYVPFWQDLLKTRPLTATELSISLAVATLPFWAEEGYKCVRRWRVQ